MVEVGAAPDGTELDGDVVIRVEAVWFTDPGEVQADPAARTAISKADSTIPPQAETGSRRSGIEGSFSAHGGGAPAR